jgi:hypothetical protein
LLSIRTFVILVCIVMLSVISFITFVIQFVSLTSAMLFWFDDASQKSLFIIALKKIHYCKRVFSTFFSLGFKVLCVSH